MKKQIGDLFAILVVVVGTLSSVLALRDEFKSTQTVIYVLIGITSLTFIYVLANSITWLNNVRSGYAIYRTACFIGERKAKIVIGENFKVSIEIVRSLIFDKPPKANELVDMMDTIPRHRFSDSAYQSNDSEIASIRMRRPHVMAVQWVPKGRILPLVPYMHHTINSSPSLYGPDYFYHSVYFDRRTGLATFDIKVPQELELLVAFRLPFLMRTIDEPVLERYVFRYSRRDCPQPTYDKSRGVVKWRLETPSVGRIYVIFGLYRGELEHFIALSDSKKIGFRVGSRCGRALNAIGFMSAPLPPR